MKKIKYRVREVIGLLVLGRFQEVEALTAGVRLSADQIDGAIAEYGRVLALPPEEGYKLMDVLEIENSNPRRWSVVMPLWTNEEGRSDLSIELTLIENSDQFSVELDDIHTL